MIKMIFETLGKPPEEELRFIANENAKKFVLGLPIKSKTSISKLIHYENPEALDLLD